MQKLCIGFLIEKLELNQYDIDLINFVSNNKHFETPFIITGYQSINLKKKSTYVHKYVYEPISKFIRNILLIIIKRIETRKVSDISLQHISKSKFSRNKEKSFQEEISSIIKSYRLIDYSENTSILELVGENFDYLVHLGSNNLPEDIFKISKFGVISIRYGNNDEKFSELTGFCEVLNSEPSTRFSIFKENNTQGKVEIFYNANLMTANIWHANKAQIIQKGNFFLKEFLLKLATKSKLPSLKIVRSYESKTSNDVLNISLLKYLITVILPKIYNAITAKLFSSKIIRYSVAYAYHNNHRKSLDQYIEILNPKGRFLADPFVFEHNNINYIFVEDFFYSDNKGRISVIKVEKNTYEFIDIVLEEDFHLSFPFIFSEDGQIYMIPESYENRDIRLYKCVEFPHKWQLENILMFDVSAVDTIVIKRNHTWFMLTNICSAGLDDHQSELHIFYSDNLMSNIWHPIDKGNPVIFNSLKSRNGGLFYHNGKTYRVNQVHGHAHYGKSFDINEIVHLSKNKYEENKILSINANFKNDIIATHHFSANENIAAIDFTRYQRKRIAIKT